MSLIQSLSPEFRQRCEAIATEQRSLLRVRSFEPLPADTLAAKLGATLFTPDQVTNFEAEQLAVLLANDGWSGVIISDRPLWIVYTPVMHLHDIESNLMHEIAHVLLNHQSVGFDPVTGLPKRKQNNEDEATYANAFKFLNVVYYGRHNERCCYLRLQHILVRMKQ